MCHVSPTAQILGLLVTLIGGSFVVWHILCFDRGRCLIFSRRNMFRWVVLVMLLLALSFFLIWNALLVWVKYLEYYTIVPLPNGGSEIVPVPFQLWSAARQTLTRYAYHILSVGWGLLVAVHAEETLYWAYLIGAIRNRDPRSWFQSKQFIIWVFFVVTALAVMPGVACIDTTDLNQMEHFIFFGGGVLALILFIGSLWLLIVFPNFIQESRRQGANPEVLGRLQYFKELNVARTVFRFFYALSLLTLSIDAFTEHKYVNTTPFWLDTLFCTAHFCALTSTSLSVMILLPRSMVSEAGVKQSTAPVFVRQLPRHTYNKEQNHNLPSDSDISTYLPNIPSPRDVERQSVHNAWGVLGERLNLENVNLDDLAASSNNSSEMFDLPFAARPGARRLEEGEQVQEVPRQLNYFRGPLESGPREPVDLNVVVITDTVVEKD